MAGNTVLISVAGDSQSIERAFSRVTSSAQDASKNLGKSAGDMKGAFDKLDGAAGGTERGLRGLKDGFTGTGDVMKAFKDGDITGMIAGFTDLAGFVGDFAGPVLQSVMSRLGLMTGATAAQTAATGAATGAQTGLNAALAANPIGAVVAAIAALVAIGFVVVKNWDTIKGAFSATWGWIKDRVGDLVGLFSDLPNKLKSAGSTIFDVITWPYRTAFNAIADFWNRTVGQLKFEAPDWVPGIGGKGFSMPQLPKFHDGGIVPGAPGTEVPIMAMAGERVTQAGRGGASVNIVVNGAVDPVSTAKQVQELLLGLQRRTGPLGFTV